MPGGLTLRRLESLLGGVDEIVFEFDADGTYLNVWTSNEKILVRPKRELIGRKIADFLEPAFTQKALETFRRVLSTGRVETLEYPLKVQQGLRWFWGWIHPIQGENGAQTLCFLARDITERKRDEEALQSSNAVLKAIIESTADAILVTDRQRQAVAYNQKYAELCRAAGIPNAVIESGDAARMFAAILQCVKDPEKTRAQVEFLNGDPQAVRLEPVEFKDGRVFERYSQPYRIQDQWLGRVWSFRDISERRRTEERLAKQREEQKIIFDSVPALIWYKDTENNILRVNRPAADSMGLSVAAIEGRSTYALYPAEAAQYHQDDLEVIRSGQPKRGIVEPLLTGSGEKIWIQTDKIPYRDAQGNIIGVIVFSQNITERKQAEDRLKRQLEMDALIYEVSSIISRCADKEMDAGIESALRRIVEAVGVDNAFILVASDDQMGWSLTHQWCRPGIDSGRDHFKNVPMSTYPYGTALLMGGQILRVDQVEDFPPEAVLERQIFESLKIRSMLLVPLRGLGGRVIAAIGFDMFESERCWTDDDVRLLRMTGDLFVSALVRKRAEAESRLLQALTLAVTQARNMDDALEVTIRLICETTGWKLGQAWVPSRDRQALVLSPAWHSAVSGILPFRTACEQLIFPFGIGMPGRVWQNRKAAWIRDVTQEPNFSRSALARELGIKAGVGFPVLSKGEVAAVLEFFMVDPRPEDDRLVRLVTAVAAELGMVFEQKSAQRLLEESENRMRTIISNMPLVLFALDCTGVFTLSEGKGLESIGRKPGEAVGQSVFDMYRDYPTILQNVRTALSGRTVHDLISVQNTVFETWYEPLRDEEGNLFGVIGVAVDITERKKVEEALERQTQELMRSNSDLQQFASIASHDLKEPLRSIVGYLQLLEQKHHDRLEPEGSKYIARTVAAASRMKALIDDLLYYSRVGRDPTPLAPVQSEAVLEKVLDNLRPLLEANEAKVTWDPLPPLLFPETQLIQLFQNLISNAIKFRHREAPRVHLHAEEKPEEWIFSVRDNGIGIEPQYHEKIFMIFNRLHPRGDYPGTGIGLAICKKIVEGMGGRIWVQSEVSRGSTFFFSVPRKGGHS